MEKYLFHDRALTLADTIILKNLADDINSFEKTHAISNLFGSIADSSSNDDPRNTRQLAREPTNSHSGTKPGQVLRNDAADLARLRSFNDPAHPDFESPAFLGVRRWPARFAPILFRSILHGYICWARRVVRRETDVVLLTQLIVYSITSVPSALLLYWHFTYLQGCLHLLMQLYYMGTYTLLMHQHIHMRGILARKHAYLDCLFPYFTDPLMGHTWNSYFHHHVKHHHVEGNGPDDLSSTIRYERDSFAHFLLYCGRFFFLVWLDLPLYFVRKGRLAMAARAAAWEFLSYFFYSTMVTLVNAKATLFVFILPLLLVRLGLMVGNWGQHAFVDPDSPDSDYRSSITLIDVTSNRFCFNDGYHTSHHLNPNRHWRDHPISFLEEKHTYANEGALVFHNIDFLMITFRLLRKDYHHLAKCLVPLGDQVNLTLEQRVHLLRKQTRKFTEVEIREKFRRRSGRHN